MDGHKHEPKKPKKPEKPKKEPLAVSATEGAPWLGICPATLIELGERGKVPMLKLGPKTFRFPVAYLKRMASGELGSVDLTEDLGPKGREDEAA